MKQYITRQRFEYQKYNIQKGSWDKEGYLLQSEDVEEFHEYLDKLKWSYDKAFSRITGKEMSNGDGPIYRDIVLVVETIKIA